MSKLDLRCKVVSVVIEACDTKGNYDLQSPQVMQNITKFVQLHRGTKFWFILHDKDKNEEGELLRKHYHLVLQLPNRMVLNKVLRDLCHFFHLDPIRIGVDKGSDLNSLIQYLVHFNEDVDKFRYDVNDIRTNSFDVLQSAFTEKDTLPTMIQIQAVVESSSSLIDVYKYFGTKMSLKLNYIIFNLWNEKKKGY